MTTISPGQLSLADLFSRGTPDAEYAAQLRPLRRRVALPLMVVAALIGVWCAWAPLHGAVVATGKVQTELGRKVVQHQEGGILRQVLVRQGQVVRRGEALIVVGDIRGDAGLDLLRKQADAERIRVARVRAELRLASTVEWPEAAADEALVPESRLFDARRRTLTEQLTAMESQAHEAKARARALSAELQAFERATDLARDELTMNAELARNGFVQKAKLITLERTMVDLSGRTEAARGEIAEANMQFSALMNLMAQARGSYQQRAADELKEASTRLREIEDRLRPTQDLVDRQTVRSPVDGTVMALRVSAPGTAVGPREPLLEIAPANENLIVELHIDPHDIDHVRKDDPAEVRLSAYSSRRAPLLQARVVEVSPDAIVDEDNKQAWYVARVEVRTDELAKHPHLRLQAGMPAEVFVTTPARSLLDYLLEPLGDFARRALREPSAAS
ncbi:MAG TPA: HlyD family type I secretion periplasmic adaptor subunit [Burkholderiales bacterium]|nr:HlyD family type I secretion periplasmic adaptor subunit [Burkholderiales bacterium]